MVQNFHLPPTGFGPGSQPAPEEGPDLEYMELPQDMRTYSAHYPDVETLDGLAPAMGVLEAVAAACERVAAGAPNMRFDLSGLDAENRRLIAETMGEGEVAMKLRGVPAVAVQESVFAGIWSLNGAEIDAIEVGAAPEAARSRAFVPNRAPKTDPASPAVVNAPALLAELEDKSASYAGELHVINLTLLPHTEGDLEWLDQRLGLGSVDILSRGYGNCRVRSTALPHVWRVQFFNSMDSLILDTFEVTDLPEVALAAPEDISDSGERLREVMEAIR